MAHGQPPEDPSESDGHPDDQDDWDDDEVGRPDPLPDPRARSWVHPSELPFGPAIVASPSPARARAHSVVTPIVVGAAGAIIAVACLTVIAALDHDSAPLPRTSRVDTANTLAGRVADPPTRARASVVSIVVRDASGVRRGAGVCVRHEGEVLTTAQLLGDAEQAVVTGADGATRTARVIGRDATTDLVLLTLETPLNIPAAPLATREPGVGTSVWVVGPTSDRDGPWTSYGALATNNALVGLADGPQTDGLLATNATTASTANGGALVGDDGSVVGIVLGQIPTPNDNAAAMTYSLPISRAISVAEQLRVDGAAEHGSAGLATIDTAFGPVVVSMNTNGPADTAGVRNGDVIVAVGDHPVRSAMEVAAAARGHAPGSAVRFTVVRGGTRLTLDLRLASTRG